MSATSPIVPPRLLTDRRPLDAAEKASRRWRAIWRTHFYAGMLAMPFLLVMAITGLVILYTQPIKDLTQHDLRIVRATGTRTSFDAQQAAVRAVFPDAKITTIVIPRNATTSTSFGLDNGREVFVNPYTAEVLGSDNSSGGIVGLANRLHGNLNNSQLKLSLPSLSGFIGAGPIMQKYVVGDMALEILGGWALVLVASGVYLWWPRRTRTADARSKRSLFVPRLAKKGRARWRDLHAIPGALISLVIGFILISGMPWSSYWGPNYTAVADKITPNKWVDAPNSSVAKFGDLDRLGNKINWNTGGAVLPNSTPDASKLPAHLSLDSLVAIAEQEGMKPGYSISYPADGKDEAGNATFGSYTLTNSWPRKTGEAKTVYLDQFSGKKISSMDVYGYGAISRGTDTLVSVHMGTQLGIVSRIAMTAACVLVIWSVISALTLFLKRRRPGTVSLPRRPRDLRMANRLIAITAVMAVIYPLWGATAVAVLAFDKFVIRRTPRLRAAFGQR